MKRLFTLVVAMFMALPLFVGCTHEGTETPAPAADAEVVETETVEMEEPAPAEEPAP